MYKLMTSKYFKMAILVIFILYILFIIFAVLLKNGDALFMREAIKNTHALPVSITPFVSILPYLKGETSISIAARNLLGNTLIFSPLGFILPLLSDRFSKFKNILFISVIFSLSIEISQLIFYLGACDVDDLILNVVGSLLGFSLFHIVFMKNMLRFKVNSKKSINID